MSKPIYEEIIDEIATQILARRDLNVFKLNTFKAYGSSVTATNTIFYQSDKRKGMLNPNIEPKQKQNESDESFQKRKAEFEGKSDEEKAKMQKEAKEKGKNAYSGYMFEPLEVGSSNIKDSLFDTGAKTYRTDEIADLKTVAGMVEDGKKPENLSPKDRKKYEHVLQNYPDELEQMKDKNSVISKLAKEYNANDETTDTIKISKDNSKTTAQHKVVKNVDSMLKKVPLKDENGKNVKDENGNIVYKKDENGNYVRKYSEVDQFKVPRDDYQKHINELDKIINDPNTPEDKKKAAQDVKEKLKKEQNFIFRSMCENPKTTAVAVQTAVATGHMVQAGLSDGAMVALSILVNGAIYEIKDALSENGEKISALDRIKRLIKKAMASFKKDGFIRGSSYGALEVLMGIVSQIFKSFSRMVTSIWKSVRDSAKSIYNAFYDFITGKVNSFEDLLSTIIKAIFSASIVILANVYEKQLEAFFASMVGPTTAEYLSSFIVIVVGAIAVVLGTKAIEASINSFFVMFSSLKKSNMKRAKIEAIVDEYLPKLMEDNAKLEEMISTKFLNLKLSLDSSFADLQKAICNDNHVAFVKSLVGINSAYGTILEYADFNTFDKAMLSDEPIRF
ncbi:hypothetical protein [Campylobacter geochelonis]|uniref:hypothetical protein n=1 Tax=Campylobacter geochelonis TaxID=1780362 RepID=UPI00077097CA|nr:hypothetical protein [Campylobacter geochelonis]CZE51342.1 Uncharacterised protein [Campylobacter geochelonis]